ncbi:NAD(P)H-binding protein [Georgenia subflava]|uniref:NAD(P)H-binding protein n=1 Tax=Georgenia subflava TaxID=1622177 RepID=A0A6N7EGJ2_9MICO|nr:NAD(P)H-binding protein [Georgenia subflava]MPV35807.1 NAD(P)H-binding protein [Georgenia subflava]
MSTQRILLTSGTGTIGRRVVNQLRARGSEVAVASRTGPVRFDWTDPDTWDAALTGCRTVFLLAPDGVEVDPRFVGRAVEQGARRLVLLSSKAIDVMGDQRLLDAEATVKAAGVGWTVVRADWLDQNFDEGFLRDAVAGGEVVLPLGDVRQTLNDADDVAAVAVAALTEEGHEGRTYELSGPEALSFGEAVGIVAEAVGRPVRYQGDAEAYVDVMTGLGRDRAEVLAEVAAFDALRRSGDAVADDTVERVTGRRPKDFRTYAAEAAAAGAWDSERE